MIENTILDLLPIHYLDWWRHWLFSLIRETFVKQTFFKNSEMFFLFYRKFFEYLQLSYCNLFRKVFCSYDALYPRNFQMFSFCKVSLINENNLWRHHIKKWIAYRVRMALSNELNFVSIDSILERLSGNIKLRICQKRSH